MKKILLITFVVVIIVGISSTITYFVINKSDTNTASKDDKRKVESKIINAKILRRQN